MTIRKQQKLALFAVLNGIQYGEAPDLKTVSVREGYQGGPMEVDDIQADNSTTQSELSYPYIYFNSEDLQPNNARESTRSFGGLESLTYLRGYQYRVNIVFHAGELAPSDDLIDELEEKVINILQSTDTRNRIEWEDLFVEAVSGPIDASGFDASANQVIKSFLVMCTREVATDNDFA